MKSKKIGELPRIEKPYQELYPKLDLDRDLTIYFRSGAAAGKPSKANGPSALDSKEDKNASEGELPDPILFETEPAKFTPQMQEVGYTTAFSLPDGHYLRNDPLARPLYPESVLPGEFRGLPCQEDGLELVEYDMDEQDLGFLGYLVAQYQIPLTAEIFETAFSMLELESFKISLNIKPKDGRLQQIDETQQCCICNEADVDNSNSIVYCDGCDIAVHQECYGVPFIPEGQWLCRRCKSGPQGSLAPCHFCPHRAGALTRTKEGQWAHTVCALWIPELGVGNAVYMEPIVGTARIPRDRWRLTCFICQKRMGAPIQCVFGDCTTAFHATCAQAAGLSMTLTHGIAGALADPSTLVAYCSRHTPQDAPVHADTALVRKTLEIEASQAQEAKEADLKLYPEWRTKKGTIYVPKLVMNTVRDNIMRRFHVDLSPAMPSLCRYWTLKRDDVGAMFSKRLIGALDASRQEYFSAEENAYELALEKKRLEELLHIALGVKKNLEGRAGRRR